MCWVPKMLMPAVNCPHLGYTQDGGLAALQAAMAADEALQRDAAQHLILISNRMIEGVYLMSVCIFVQHHARILVSCRSRGSFSM